MRPELILFRVNNKIIVTGTLLWGLVRLPVWGRALGAVVGIGTTEGVGGRIGADWARRTAAVAAFLWRVGCKMFKTSVICSRLMSGWSASNLLIKPWSTKSSRVLAAGALIPSWGTVGVAGTGRETSGMGKWVGTC